MNFFTVWRMDQIMRMQHSGFRYRSAYPQASSFTNILTVLFIVIYGNTSLTDLLHVVLTNLGSRNVHRDLNFAE